MQLYDWQQPLASRLHGILATQNTALNCLPTGIGKTYLACHLAAQMGLKPAVIAPKATLSAWRLVAEGFGIVADVINWELLWSRGASFFAPAHMDWSLDGRLLVIDEVHRGCSGPQARNAKALALAKHQCPTVLQSATLASGPLQLRAVGYLLGLHAWRDFYNWALSLGAYPDPVYGTWRFDADSPKGREGLDRLAVALSPFMLSADVRLIPGFPSSLITAKLFDLSARNRQEIDDAYAAMRDKLKLTGMDSRVEAAKAKERVEMCKVDLLIELAQASLEAGDSVVVFFGYRAPLKRFTTRLGLPVVTIIGDQTQGDRESAMLAFQENRVRCCAATMGAGGLGINLHDVKHERPRQTYMSADYSAANCRQALGRVCRAGGTNSRQMFVLAAGTCEERVYAKLQTKLAAIDQIQDEDLI